MKARERERMNLLIVDDHKVVRDGIRFVLGDHSKYQFRIHEASDVSEALYFGTTFNYDAILMDINIKRDSGVDVTRKILEQRPVQNILAFTVREDELTVRAMIHAGAKGYLLKDSGSEELVQALETVSKGKTYYSNRIALKLMGVAEDEAEYNDKQPISSMVNKRERQIIELISQQKTNAEIGVILGLKKNTIDDYRKKIISKFNLKNTAGLVHFAMKHKIIE